MSRSGGSSRASRMLGALWPFRPADVLVIAAAAVVVSVLAFDEVARSPSGVGWWLGAFVGSLFVGVLARERCRASVRRRNGTDQAR